MWNSKDDEYSDWNDFYHQKEREDFLSTSKKLQEDDSYVDQYLIENGYDPEKLAQGGINFIRSLFEKYNTNHGENL